MNMRPGLYFWQYPWSGTEINEKAALRSFIEKDSYNQIKTSPTTLEQIINKAHLINTRKQLDKIRKRKLIDFKTILQLIIRTKEKGIIIVN